MSIHNGHAPTSLEAAQALVRRGIMPLPLAYGVKNPNRPKWEQERYTDASLDAFRERVNVGMRLGHITDPRTGRVLTDRFADADLDTPEAVRAAPLLLPKTGMMWGREGNPRSHYGYRLRSLNGAKSLQNLTDPLRPKDKRGKSDASICELRFSGQTLAPGSMNEDGHAPELVRWEPDGDGEPAEVEFEALANALRKLHAAALIARYWSDGIRHLAALPLAGMLCRGGMNETEAMVFVRAVCVAACETADDTQNRLACVRDTYAKSAAGEPYTASPTLEDYLDPHVVAAIRKSLALRRGSGSGDLGPDGFPLSDVGNGERFAARWGEKALYCDDQNVWWIYDTHDDGSEPRWQQDRANRVYRMAATVVNEFRMRIADRTQPQAGNTTPEQWDRHARESSKMKGIRAMLEYAKALLPVLPEEFDNDDFLLNVRNGTVVLDTKTGKHYVRAPRPQDLITKLYLANYDPDATHSDVDEYRAMFMPEQDRWEFLEEAAAYSLVGGPKRFNFQLLGPSNSGKSMLLRILNEQAGDYGATLRWEALKPDAHGGGDKPRSDLVELRGARILTISEVGAGAVWDTVLFKTMLSGGDSYKVRGAYERRTQTFPFTVALWTSGNKPYGIDAEDDAAYERIRVIKFDHQRPQGERDEQREHEIVDPARTGDAFLACWLRGFTRLYGEKGGKLIAPDSVREATEDVRKSLDPYTALLEPDNPEKAFLEVTGDDNDGVLVFEAWEWARHFREADGATIRQVGREKAAFAAALERRGARSTRSRARFGNRECWVGVRWTESFVEKYKQAGGFTLPDWQQADGA